MSDDDLWVKPSETGSWHIVDIAPEGDEPGSALCGRDIPSGTEVHPNWVGNERTCESCLRISSTR